MTTYIDGFVFPVARDRLSEYKVLANQVAKIWKEYGALDYCEFSGDDMSRDGTRSFTDVMSSNEDEIIVFGWVEFESREARDLINAKVSADPRMPDLLASSNAGFDAERMIYGGFRSMVGCS